MNNESPEAAREAFISRAEEMVRSFNRGLLDELIRGREGLQGIQLAALNLRHAMLMFQSQVNKERYAKWSPRRLTPEVTPPPED